MEKNCFVPFHLWLMLTAKPSDKPAANTAVVSKHLSCCCFALIVFFLECAFWHEAHSSVIYFDCPRHVTDRCYCAIKPRSQSV